MNYVYSYSDNKIIKVCRSYKAAMVFVNKRLLTVKGAYEVFDNKKDADAMVNSGSHVVRIWPDK